MIFPYHIKSFSQNNEILINKILLKIRFKINYKLQWGFIIYHIHVHPLLVKLDQNNLHFSILLQHSTDQQDERDKQGKWPPYKNTLHKLWVAVRMPECQKTGEAVVVWVEEEVDGESSWLWPPSFSPELLLFRDIDASGRDGGWEAMGAYTPLELLVSPEVGVEVAAMVVYSGGVIHIPPTTTNWGVCGLLLLWIVGVGLLVCKRYFCKIHIVQLFRGWIIKKKKKNKCKENKNKNANL